MKLRTLILVATLALGGCATFDPTAKSILIGGPSVIAPIKQPVTKQDMLAIESGYQTGLIAVANYRRFCYSAPLTALPAFCQNRRQVMLAAQAAVSKARIIMRSLRYFVANNDTVNAIAVFNAMKTLIADLATTVAVTGVAP